MNSKIFCCHFDSQGRSLPGLSFHVAELTGYEESDLARFPEGFISILSPVGKQELGRRMKDFLNGSQHCIEFNAEVLKKEGTKRNFQFCLFTDKESENIVLTGFDNTDYLMEISMLQERVQESASLDLRKDKFISILSHDLRTPFTSLLGFSEILLNEKDLPEDQRTEYLKYMHEASEEQLVFLDSLLSYSRLRSLNTEIKKTRVPVRELLQRVVDSFIGSSMQKSISLDYELSEDLFVLADESLLIQCLNNLIGNAMKFTPRGGKVLLSAGRFGKGSIEFAVNDDGVGISDQNQPKLFRIDQKLSTTGTSGERGSGLGLLLVKEIVEKSGGKIWFRSKESEGSEFHITFPEAGSVAVPGHNSPLQQGPETIKSI